MTARTRDLERARACYARREWADAFTAFSEADRSQPLGHEVDLSTFARTLEGRALLRQGRIEHGLALLDDAERIAGIVAERCRAREGEGQPRRHNADAGVPVELR